MATTQDDGRFGVADRATHEQSRVAPSLPSVGIPSAMTVYAASALARNRRNEIILSTRISFVSEAEAVGLAMLAVDGEGYELVSHHLWWEDVPASAIEAATAGETPKSGSTEGESAVPNGQTPNPSSEQPS